MKTQPFQQDNLPQPKGIVRQFTGPLTILLIMLAISRYAIDYWPQVESHIAQMGPLGFLAFSLLFIRINPFT